MWLRVIRTRFMLHCADLELWLGIRSERNRAKARRAMGAFEEYILLLKIRSQYTYELIHVPFTLLRLW